MFDKFKVLNIIFQIVRFKYAIDASVVTFRAHMLRKIASKRARSIDYLSFLLISVYLQDLQEQRYDDLRGEWVQV